MWDINKTNNYHQMCTLFVFQHAAQTKAAELFEIYTYKYMYIHFNSCARRFTPQCIGEDDDLASRAHARLHESVARL